MRYLRKFAILIVGFVVGALLSGFLMFEYMAKFGIQYNEWVAKVYMEGRADEALSKVTALRQLQSGDLVKLRKSLEMGLINDTIRLTAMKQDGHDPKDVTDQALSKIRDYRRANPWASGSDELDRTITDELNKALDKPATQEKTP